MRAKSGNGRIALGDSLRPNLNVQKLAMLSWRDASKKDLAAQALRITASDLQELGCIDDVLPEPEGGAHRDHEAAAALLAAGLQKHYSELKKIPASELVASRYNKFRHMAEFFRGE